VTLNVYYIYIYIHSNKILAVYTDVSNPYSLPPVSTHHTYSIPHAYNPDYGMAQYYYAGNDPYTSTTHWILICSLFHVGTYGGAPILLNHNLNRAAPSINYTHNLPKLHNTSDIRYYIYIFILTMI
jgi:hypothetical protein